MMNQHLPTSATTGDDALRELPADIADRYTAGKHGEPDEGMCLVEAAAYMAGEPFSDHPQCVDPVIAAFARTWHDRLPDDATRVERSLPLVSVIVGTKGSAELSDRRAVAVGDWCWRHVLPVWLDVAGLAEQATALRSRPEATTVEELRDLQGFGDAAWDAARDAARDAAGAAAGAAAWDAAWAAARDAAGDAARAAAGDAARAALAPTVTQLQRDGADLIRRLVTITEATS